MADYYIENNNVGVVYVWENIVNGMKYIGSHNNSHIDTYIGSGTHFNFAIKKYGIENFVRKIIYQGNFYREVETLIILSLDICESDEWYNISHIHKSGSYISKDHKAAISKSVSKSLIVNTRRAGKKQSPEEKIKRSNSLKGKSHTQEHKNNISKAHLGKTLSAEHKAKIGIKSKGRTHSWVPTEEQRNKMRIAAKLSRDRKKENQNVVL